MLSEKEVRDLLCEYEEKIEDLKGFINNDLDKWTGKSVENISSFVKTISVYKHKIRTLREVLEETK